MQLTKFLDANKLIDPMQSCFRSKNSTATVTIKATTNLRIAVDGKKIAIVILFSVSKGFDVVNHELLRYVTVLEKRDRTPGSCI